jgi:hypothetical protein
LIIEPKELTDIGDYSIDIEWSDASGQDREQMTLKGGVLCDPAT